MVDKIGTKEYLGIKINYDNEKILDKFNDWKAYAIGNERRETHNFNHKNFEVIDWLPHEKILTPDQ